jgi:integrase
VAKRRAFGAVRQLPSGRWQARLLPADGGPHIPLGTFTTKADAARALAAAETDIDRGDWKDPRAVGELFSAYAATWLTTRRLRGRPLSPVTLQLYERRLRREIRPTFGDLPLEKITTAAVRDWYAEVTKVGATTAAQSYRLLHAILATAVSDSVLERNPCVLRGAGYLQHEERPLVTRGEMERLADAMPVHLRPLVSLAFWGGLRMGELLGLRVGDVDLDAQAGSGVLRVERQLQETGGEVSFVEPKASSRRTINLYGPIVAELESHLRSRSFDAGAQMFVRADGSPLRGHHVHSAWKRARVAVGMPHVRVHDLRHGGLTLAAQSGAPLAEVMRRAGHSTSRAALLYQHAADDRDAEVVRRMTER